MQFNEFKDRVGEIVNGVVKRVEYGNLIVDLGKGEAILRREELLNREFLEDLIESEHTLMRLSMI